MTNESIIEDAEMPTLRIKRPHNKVRSGCTTCKSARVKVSGLSSLNENDSFDGRVSVMKGDLVVQDVTARKSSVATSKDRGPVCPRPIYLP